MIRLRKNNVERIAETTAQTARWKSEGFQEIGELKTADDAEEPTQEPEKMTVKQLRELAKKKGLEGASSLSREELLQLMDGEM